MTVTVPVLPEGLSPIECNLWMDCRREWEPRLRLSTQAIRIPIVSQRAKDALSALAMATGMTVRFTESNGQGTMYAMRDKSWR